MTVAEHPCIFDGSESVGRFKFDRGCVCFPNVKEMDLCAQHVINAEPLGNMEVLIEYVEGWCQR